MAPCMKHIVIDCEKCDKLVINLNKWQTCDKSNKKYEEKKKTNRECYPGWCYKYIHIYIFLYLSVYTPPLTILTTCTECNKQYF